MYIPAMHTHANGEVLLARMALTVIEHRLLHKHEMELERIIDY